MTTAATTINLSRTHEQFIQRFVAACQADARVVAAFLGGSYAKGTADAYSDLDLGLITTDAAYEDFLAGRRVFVRLLGEPAFEESFNLPGIVFLIFSDGAECELALGRAGDFLHMHAGPYRALLDKVGILEGVAFSGVAPEPAEQVEALRRLAYVFWHDLSHFITAMARGQLWWAYGQLEALRRYCVNLARLRQNFADSDVGEEGYFKLEQALPVEQLAPLQVTYCPLEQGAMLQAALVIVGFYQELARQLAQAHGIPYPADLERVMCYRLEQVCKARLR